MSGGATPSPDGRSLLLSLRRMNAVRALDVPAGTIVCEAGVILRSLHVAAEGAGLRFPLTLGGKGSATVGGLISTNAGGTQVLRHGSMREQVLGLEAVLADGSVWSALTPLKKDNRGIDLKHLLIGAEGTLGIISAAVLKLFPLPKMQTTCWLSLPDAAAAVNLINRAKSAFDARLTAFELVSETALGLVLQHIPQTQRPVAPAPWYVLAEFSDTAPADVENWLAECLDCGLLSDGVIAQSAMQAERLWALRENISEAQKFEGISIKHDIAVPVSRIPDFLAAADAALLSGWPGIRIVAFGHVGDGNLHYNLSRPTAGDNAAFIASQPAVNAVVHDIVHALNGSISAEHGLGQLKREEILRYKSATEMALMRAIKQALDPLGLMNPGKVL